MKDRASFRQPSEAGVVLSYCRIIWIVYVVILISATGATAQGSGAAVNLGALLDASWWLNAAVTWGPALALFVTVYFAYKRFAHSEVYQRLVRSLSNDVLTNWRLVLLGITGIVLSLASGWTTWDGMTNFTRSPLLSVLITFGIQGVMLIAAWLIGETFAQSFTGKGAKAAGGIVGAVFAVFAVVVIGILLAIWGFPRETALWTTYFSQNWQQAFEALVIFTLGLFVLAGIIYAFGQGEIISPYLRGTKVILRNLPLWIMFLACMGTSVFFSFDSLFSTIFPQDERARAADLRVRNQVQGVIADVGVRIQEHRKDAIVEFFNSDGWVTFNSDLSRLVSKASGASEAVKQLKLERVKTRSQEEQQERMVISRAQSERQSLQAEKARLEAEISAVQKDRRPEQARVAALEKELVAKREEILVTETAAKGEAQGIRGTGKSGRGPEWRRLRNKVADLQLDEDELQSRLKVAQRRLALSSVQSTANQTKVREINERLAVIDVQAGAAEERLRVRGQASSNDLTADLDAVGGLKALERERALFRGDPTRTSFDDLQQFCSSLLVTVRRVPQLREGTDNIDCEPKAASEMASRVFAFNNALKTFDADCTTGRRLASGSADAFLQHGNDCIQASRLSGADTAEFRTALNRVALNRDDKAHRFVVTVNAFSDGNRLAYLALAIAIAIDGLVFMSGLFGANAVRSPLADAPIDKSRTAVQLETTVNNSLGPEGAYRYSTARIVLGAMQTITPIDGYMAEVDLGHYGENEAARIRNVLNAGATLNLVASHAQNPNLFRVRSEFFEYLNLVCERQLQTDAVLREELRRDGHISESRREEDQQIEEIVRRLEMLLDAATEPHQRAGAESALRSMKPLTGNEKYPIYIDLTEALERYKIVVRQIFETVTKDIPLKHLDQNSPLHDNTADARLQLEQLTIAYEDTVRHVLNVGATERAVEHDTSKERPSDEYFFVSKYFHRALIMLRKQGVANGQKSLDEVIENRAREIIGSIRSEDQDFLSHLQNVTEQPSGIAQSERPNIIDERGLSKWLVEGDRVSNSREQILQDFLRRLQIDQRWYTEIEASVDSENFLRVRRGLEDVARQNSRMASQISGIIDTKGVELEEARRHFSQSYRTDAELIDDVAAEIRSLIGVLLIPQIQDAVRAEVRSVSELRQQISEPFVTHDGTAPQFQEDFGLRDAFQTISAFEPSERIDETLPELIKALDEANKILRNSITPTAVRNRA